MHSLLFSVIPALLILSSQVTAQVATGSLAVGARVRVTRECVASTTGVGVPPCRLTGRLVELGTDTLVVQSEASGSARFGRETIERIQLSVGRRSHARSGAVVGAMAGGLITYFSLFTGGPPQPATSQTIRIGQERLPAPDFFRWAQSQAQEWAR